MTRTRQADDLIVVRTYDYRHEAEIGRSILEANAVDAVISADDLGGLQPMLGAANGGVRLSVRRRDERKAKKLLGRPLALRHQTVRVTPAMEARLADHVWSVEEIVRLLERER